MRTIPVVIANEPTPFPELPLPVGLAIPLVVGAAVKAAEVDVLSVGEDPHAASLGMTMSITIFVSN